MAVGCPMHFVLDTGKQLLERLCPGVVVNTGGVNVRRTLRQNTFSDERMSRMRASNCSKYSIGIRVLQALIIQHEALDQVFLQPLGGPAGRNWVPRNERTR